uniref:Transmembrane protein 138 n=1 Tax=Angiostrongylus cantonensis TaxID=6313 RepID=A0A0K0DC31_ANGCA
MAKPFFVLSHMLAFLYQMLLDHCTIVSILFGIHLLCALLSLTFLVFCFLKKKFGSSYQILLHAYLLSIVINGLKGRMRRLWCTSNEWSLIPGIDLLFCTFQWKYGTTVPNLPYQR